MERKPKPSQEVIEAHQFRCEELLAILRDERISYEELFRTTISRLSLHQLTRLQPLYQQILEDREASYRRMKAVKDGYR